MEIGKSIYNILYNNIPIRNIINTRIYPNVAPQASAIFPFIIYDVVGVEPTNYKSGPSSLDTNKVMISAYCKTYSEASDLANKIRIAMDRIPNGTYNGEEIQSSEFQGYNDIFDATSSNAGIYRKALDFQIRQINPTN
tara:strand:+ start:2670 stop:3083 length:414 start_codon:yes stop_codon:yes gene_type:complete